MKINKLFQKPFNAIRWNADSGKKCSKQYAKTYGRAVKEFTDKGELSMVSLEQNLDDVIDGLRKTKDFYNYSFEEKMACLPNKKSIFCHQFDSKAQMYWLFTKHDNDKEEQCLDIGLLIEKPDHVTVSQYQGLIYDLDDNPKDDSDFAVKYDIRYDPAEYDELEGNNKSCIYIEDRDNHPDSENMYKWICMATSAFSTFAYLMGHSKLQEFSQDIIPPIKVVRNAEKKGKFPPLRYKVLNLNIFKRQGIKTGLKFPDRMKPAEHIRRAHIRRVNGVTIPVKSSIINKNIGRKIIKDYNLID